MLASKEPGKPTQQFVLFFVTQCQWQKDTGVVSDESVRYAPVMMLVADAVKTQYHTPILMVTDRVPDTDGRLELVLLQYENGYSTEVKIPIIDGWYCTVRIS